MRVAREADEAVVDVVDNGVGLPPGFSPETASGLGLSIVRTLVQSELAGELTMKNDGGTRVHLRVPIAAAPGGASVRPFGGVQGFMFWLPELGGAVTPGGRRRT